MSYNWGILSLRIIIVTNKPHPIHNSYLNQIFALYQALPRDESKAITITELMKKNSIQTAYGITTTSEEAQRKKLIRHLNQLENYFGTNLIKNDDSNHNTYYLAPSASLEDLSGNTAMLLVLAESFLKIVAPQELLQESQGVFENAHKYLAKKSQFQNWRKRLYFILDEIEKYPQFTVNETVEVTIYQALRDNSPLKISYIKTGENETKIHKGYPLKLVVTPYQRLLILDSEQHVDTVTFAMHRIQQAEIMDGLDTPEDMKLDVHKIEQNIERHTQVMWEVEPIDLEISVPSKLCYLITDNPLFLKYNPVAMLLADDYQQYEIKQVFVTMAVMDFLVANGGKVFVSEPEWLQDDIITQLKQGIKNYAT